MMKTRWFIITWVVRGMLILTILGGCVPTATPPSATSPAVLVGSGYYGQGLTDQSWASITDIANLSPLAVGAADSAILANGWVKVNNAGKAKVYKPDVCEAVYVFYDSGIQIGTGCEQDGGGNWNCVVGAAISQNCSVGIQTPAVSITTTGTYYSVISLGDSSLVLITVLEGEVRVVPVTRLNYQLNFTDRGPDLQPITKADRVENNDLAVVLHQGQSYFTAPDDYLVDLRRNLAIRSFVDAPPDRQALDDQQLQLLVNQLNEIYPALRRYVDQVREQSIQDGFNFPAVTATLLLQGGGGFLEKPDLHPVVLNGIEWPAVLKEAIPDQQVSFTYAFGDQNGLLTDRPFDPDLARQLVDRNSLGQNALSILVQEGDPTLERMVRLLTVRFKELGIPLEIGFVPAADLQPKYQATIASGIPALALSWR